MDATSSWVQVNMVVQGKFKQFPKLKSDNLPTFAQHYQVRLPSATIQVHLNRPQSIVFKFNKLTIMLFTNGKLRLMGGNLRGVDHAYKVLNFIFPHYQLDYLLPQTYTMVGSLKCSNINMLKMFQKYFKTLSYDWELFPALKFSPESNISVNLFHTGKMVAMGRKANDYALLNAIQNQLCAMIEQL